MIRDYSHVKYHSVSYLWSTTRIWMTLSYSHARMQPLTSMYAHTPHTRARAQTL